MKRLSVLAPAVVLSVAALGAAAEVLRRLLKNAAVEQAAAPGSTARVRSQDAATGELPVVSATSAASSDSPPGSLTEWTAGRPVTPVPPDAVSATSAETSPETMAPGPTAPGEAGDAGNRGLPTRTWLVDNSADWDGSPLELVVPPGPGAHRKQGPSAPYA